jgi:hypothetical protein
MVRALAGDSTITKAFPPDFAGFFAMLFRNELLIRQEEGGCHYVSPLAAGDYKSGAGSRLRQNSRRNRRALPADFSELDNCNSTLCYEWQAFPACFFRPVSAFRPGDCLELLFAAALPNSRKSNQG